VNDIEADGVQLNSQGDIAVDQINVGSRLTLSARDVDAAVRHTGRDSPLQLTLVGVSQAAMDSANLKLDSQVGINFEKLQAVNANLDVSNGRLDIADGYIGNRMSIVSPFTRLVMDNNSESEQQPFDLQLFSRTKSFSLKLDRNTLRAQGADVIHRNPMDTIVLDATTGAPTSSLAEQAAEEVSHAINVMQPQVPQPVQMTSSLLDISASGVQLMDKPINQNDNEDKKNP
jgi:hypothetical protein